MIYLIVNRVHAQYLQMIDTKLCDRSDAISRIIQINIDHLTLAICKNGLRNGSFAILILSVKVQRPKRQGHVVF